MQFSPMWMSGCGVLAIAAAWLVLGTHAAAVAAGEGPAFKEVLDRLAEAEGRLANVVVESEVWEERWKDGHWERSAMQIKGTVWRLAADAGNMRVDARQVLQWINGAAPHFEREFAAAYDGQAGRVVYHAEGPIGHAAKARRAEVFRERPRTLTGPQVSMLGGAEFSIYFYGSDGHRTLSEVLRHAADQGAAFEVADGDDEAGARVDVVLHGPGGRKETWSLAPDRGYALVAYRYTQRDPENGKEVVRRAMEVEALAEAAPGLWYPVEGTITSPGERRHRYQAERVAVNDPAFDAAVFELTLPAGYRVRDHVRDRIYTAGASPEGLER
ncbi:MAG: hypothetical protein WD009_00190 [Phycisphaeraceae bacterium]